MIVDAEPAFRTRHANPYTALLYEAIARRGVQVREYDRARLTRDPPDIVHVHWPELLLLSSHRGWQSWLRIRRFSAALRRARARGARFVVTVHNDGGHESAPGVLERSLDRMLLHNLDGALTLSAAGERAFRERFGPGIPTYRTPHGDYRGAYPLAAPRADARAALGIPPNATLLVAVGQVRPYKNLLALLEATRGVPDASLLVAVAGRPDSESTAASLRAVADRDPRMLLDLRQLDDDRLALWLSACDAVVLPYRRILTSGSAILSLSADRPVIVPATGSMPELAATVGPEWVHVYDGAITSDVLVESLRWLRRGGRGDAPDLTAFDWDHIADATISAYQHVLDRPPGGGVRHRNREGN